MPNIFPTHQHADTIPVVAISVVSTFEKLIGRRA